MNINELNVGNFITVLYYNPPESHLPFYRVTYGPIVKIVDNIIHYNPMIIVDGEFTRDFTIKKTTSIMTALPEMVICKEGKFSRKLLEKIAEEKYNFLS